jgi:hypothetical protein
MTSAASNPGLMTIDIEPILGTERIRGGDSNDRSDDDNFQGLSVPPAAAAKPLATSKQNTKSDEAEMIVPPTKTQCTQRWSSAQPTQEEQIGNQISLECIGQTVHMRHIVGELVYDLALVP